MRMALKFAKGSSVKYISHLDLQRTFQRAFRRAELPIRYSQGFNPHAKISFASALPLGVTSSDEYLDVELEDGISPVDVCNKLNQALPQGLEVLDAKNLDKGFPSLMSIINRAEYNLTYAGEGKELADGLQALNRFFAQGEIIVTKRGKKGQREINIAPLIHRYSSWRKEGGIVLNIMSSAGSKENLNPLLIVEALNNFLNVGNDGVWYIHRIGLMVDLEGKILDVFTMIDIYKDLRGRTL